jgi:hypothetical protein
MDRHEVWLESSWASLYHDLIERGLHVIRRSVRLRTQQKNAVRELDKFTKTSPPPRTPTIRISYNRPEVIAAPSHTVLEAMCKITGCHYATADFSLPLRSEWLAAVDLMLEQWQPGKPLMIYRPLVMRPEWAGSGVRNANPAHYAELLAEIREQFFIVSVADLQPSQEWIVGPQLRADITLHKGELPFELLAALFHRADLVFTSSGFAAILAPAVGTPVVSVIGGYETASWHAAGGRLAPYLGIDPRVPCECGTSSCHRPCTKELDMPLSKTRLREFVEAHVKGLSEICIQNVDKYFDAGQPAPVFSARATSRQFASDAQRGLQRQRMMVQMEAQRRGLKA